ncbi:hypothetical protein FACS1894160_1900 [Bacteroidia bacterium]|nr:hypothetical protein FACS1894160_1900 [Bacteroidia bacterium]
MLEIVSSGNYQRWNEIVRSMLDYDFYHLAEYHQLDNDGQTFLLYYTENKVGFALPIVLRAIDNTDFCDITSVYGYAGPLANIQNPNPAAVSAFHQELSRFFDDHSVVSVFSRLHPLFPEQEKLLSGLGNVIDTNLTVGIDLSLTNAEQKQQYVHSLKNTINRFKRRNMVTKLAETEAEIDAFAAIYIENMKRVNASPMYYFTSAYFHQFLHTINSSLMLAILDGKIICGSLFTECNGIIQAHLSATSNEYLKQSPLKYVWNQIRLLGMEKNERILHFGGGAGGKNDSLFQFKSQFSHLYFQFKVWKHIHNQEVYDELIREIKKDGVSTPSYFPLYRLTN